MKASQAATGRVFVIRLEDGDKLPDAIEEFAGKKNMARGLCFLIGGMKGKSKVVVGPKNGESMPVEPVVRELSGVHETLATGMLFPDDDGRPKLHMHAAFGRGENTTTGCIRLGVEVWQVAEVVLVEIRDNKACRKKDATTGLTLMQP